MKNVLKNSWIIAYRELKSYFDNPAAYIILVVFLLAWQFMFFNTVFLQGEASLRSLFDLLPWFYLFLTASMTMGSVAQEKIDGTIELILTHPISQLEFVIGKYLASILFCIAPLLSVVLISLSFSAFGNLDWGVVIAQIIAGVSLAATFCAIGVAVSSRIKTPVAALIATVGVSFGFILIGMEMVTARFPLILAPLAERLSIISHYSSMSRGVLDLRDLWFFISFIVIMLSIAYVSLMETKYGNQKKRYQTLIKGTGLFIGIALFSNSIGYQIPGRIDLTQHRLFTLGSSTVKTIQQADDLVTITLFASDKLPAQLQPVLRDIKDILRDYQTSSKGKIVVAIKNPSSDPTVAQAAQSEGIQEIQFNVVGQEEFQVKTGFLGIAIQYADKKEAIPYIQNTSSLEYDLTSLIKKLTDKNKKTLTFITGHGEKDQYEGFRLFSQELEKQYKITDSTLDTTSPIASDAAAIIVGGPNTAINEASASAVKKYLDNGGKALLLLDGATIDLQALSATENKNSFAEILKPYGVDLNKNLVYDLVSNETIRLGGNLNSYLLPYPFWPRIEVAKELSQNNILDTIVVPWGSSLALNNEVAAKNNVNLKPLLFTSNQGATISGTMDITPNKQLPQTGTGQQILGVLITKKQDNKEVPHILVVSDSDFLNDQFVQNVPENISLGISLVSTLTGQDSLSDLKIKQEASRKLVFPSKFFSSAVRTGNLAVSFIIPVGFGVWNMLRRKSLQNKKFEKKKNK